MHFERAAKSVADVSQFGFTAPKFHGTPVEILNASAGIAGIDPDRSQMEQDPETFLARDQGIFNLFAISDVTDVALDYFFAGFIVGVADELELAVLAIL